MDLKYEDVKQKLQAIKEIRVHYPIFSAILANMERCLEESVDLAEPLCMIITGDTGVGKSTIIKTMSDRHPSIKTSEEVNTPVLVASVPLPATIGALYTSILTALGAPFPDRGKIEYKRLRLFELLKRCNVRLIILDEFQHLVERGTRQRIETVADAIKSLINQTALPFILVGMPAACAVLEYSPQLAGRFPLSAEIPLFDWLEQPTSFERLLNCFEKALPFAKPSGFGDETMPARFYLATGGNFRSFTTLIRDASRSALMQDCARIEREHLIRSFNTLLAANRRLRANPFQESNTAIERWIYQLRRNQ
ncbi:transposase [Aquitalea palustris]|uniref:Transposase n=1 Tax=Aquitalea palustris TaxID=2480983 RepID=A0A454JIY4_9NEIS|nr:TniB family NTP-binding protein [Aquitalea palustris]RMC98545.1 transposase [Aquitalea palustris]